MPGWLIDASNSQKGRKPCIRRARRSRPTPKSPPNGGVHEVGRALRARRLRQSATQFKFFSGRCGWEGEESYLKSGNQEETEVAPPQKCCRKVPSPILGKPLGTRPRSGIMRLRRVSVIAPIQNGRLPSDPVKTARNSRTCFCEARQWPSLPWHGRLSFVASHSFYRERLKA